MLKKLNSEQGFTLTELLIVVAILGILVAVVLPNFVGLLGGAKTNAGAAELEHRPDGGRRQAGEHQLRDDDGDHDGDERHDDGGWRLRPGADVHAQHGDARHVHGGHDGQGHAGHLPVSAPTALGARPLRQAAAKGTCNGRNSNTTQAPRPDVGRGRLAL